MKKIESERKFILKNLPKLNFYEKIKTEQLYIQSGSDTIKRISYVRKFNLFNGQEKLYLEDFYMVEKKTLSGASCEEIITRLSAEQYLQLRKIATSEIYKTRYLFEHENIIWEFDEFSNINLVMCEVEILSDDMFEAEKKLNAIVLPDFIKNNLIIEATGMREFSNYSLSIQI